MVYAHNWKQPKCPLVKYKLNKSHWGGEDRNDSSVDLGGDPTSVCTGKIHWAPHFRIVHFVACKLYLNF